MILQIPDFKFLAGLLRSVAMEERWLEERCSHLIEVSERIGNIQGENGQKNATFLGVKQDIWWNKF